MARLFAELLIHYRYRSCNYVKPGRTQKVEGGRSASSASLALEAHSPLPIPVNRGSLICLAASNHRT
jgi:hypothetical protein